MSIPRLFDPALSPEERSAAFRAIPGQIGDALTSSVGTSANLDASSEDRRRAFASILPEWMRPRGARGEAARLESGAAAQAAKTKADDKEAAALAAHVKAGGRPWSVGKFGDPGYFDAEDISIVPAAPPAAGVDLSPSDTPPEPASGPFTAGRFPARGFPPSPGIRAFRVNGKVVYTNLPEQYAGAPRTEADFTGRPVAYGGGQELDYGKATDEERADVATHFTPSIPLGLGNFEGQERLAMVNRAREAARGGPGFSTSVELSPGAVSEYGVVSATPGYWDVVNQTLGENIRAQRGTQALDMSPAVQAKLEAMVNASKNSGLGVIKYAMQEVGNADYQIARAKAAFADANPAQKAHALETIKQLESRKETLKQFVAFAHRLNYMGDLTAKPDAAGSGDTTPDH